MWIQSKIYKITYKIKTSGAENATGGNIKLDGGDVTEGYVIMDVERLRAPMQKITDYFLKVMGKVPSADVVPLMKQG